MSLSWSEAASWLLHSALAGGLLLLLTLLLMRWTPQPARRQRLGESGLAAALAVALFATQPAWLVLPWPIAEAPPEPAVAEQPLPVLEVPPLFPEPDEDEAEFILPDLVLPEPAIVALPLAVDVMAPVEEEAESVSPPWWQTALPALVPWLVGAYALCALALLSRWLLGYAGLQRLLRDTQPAPAETARLFAEMAGARRPRLLVSKRLHVPISFGLLRPTVVLPEAMCHPPVLEKLRWVFAHELTHLERRDAWSALLFALGQTVYFCLPWFWVIRRQVRLCQEFVADAIAADREEVAADYAEFLLSLNGAAAIPAVAAGVTGNTSDLFRRVSMLLQNPIRVEKRCPRRWTLAAAGGLFALAFLLAGVDLRSEASAPQAVVVKKLADVVQAMPVQAKKIQVRIAPGAVQAHPVQEVIVVKKIEGAPAQQAVKAQVVIPGHQPQTITVVPQIQVVPAKKVVVQDVVVQHPQGGPDAIKVEIERLKVEIERLRKTIEKLRDGGHVDPEGIRLEVKDVLKKLEGFQGLKDVRIQLGSDSIIPLHLLTEDSVMKLGLHGHLDLKVAPQAIATLPGAQAQPVTERQRLFVTPDGKSMTFSPQGGVTFSTQGQVIDQQALQKLMNALKGDPSPEQIMDAVKAFQEAMKASKIRIGDLGGKGGTAGAGAFGGGKAFGGGTAGKAFGGGTAKGVGGAAGAAGGKGGGGAFGTVGGKGGKGGVAGTTTSGALGATTTSRLGAQVERPNSALIDQLELPRDQGLVVTRVTNNSPASKVGLKANDLLLEIGGKAVSSDPAKFNSMLNNIKGKTDVVVLRKGKRETLSDLDLPTQAGVLGAVMGGGKAKSGKGVTATQIIPSTGSILTTTQRTGDRFTTRYQEGSLIINVTGTVSGGKAKLGSVSIQDGGTTNNYDRLESVPAQYRDKVNHLLQVSGGGPTSVGGDDGHGR